MPFAQLLLVCGARRLFYWAHSDPLWVRLSGNSWNQSPFVLHTYYPINANLCLVVANQSVSCMLTSQLEAITHLKFVFVLRLIWRRTFFIATVLTADLLIVDEGWGCLWHANQLIIGLIITDSWADIYQMSKLLNFINKTLSMLITFIVIRWKKSSKHVMPIIYDYVEKSCIRVTRHEILKT